MIRTTITLYTADEPTIAERETIIRAAHNALVQRVLFASAEAASCVGVESDERITR